LYGELDDRPPERPDRARTVVRNIGELLITAGLVVLLFVVYEVYITDLLSAGKQREATAALDDQWHQPGQDTVDGGERTNKYDLEDGKGFAKLYLPSLGPDVHFTVLEGTSDKILESGPGHYKGTALPGQPGNFSVAGHRVGMGAPFNDLDLLQSCDAIVVETQASWFVYRMLPKTAEVAGWSGKQGNPRCEGVKPLGGAYSKTVGQEIVLPTNGGVISPVPGQAGAAPAAADQAALMTLTTCHPKFSDKQRLIVHAVLIKQWAKDPAKGDQPPPELKENN
jgi:sortase (surface protein transpeptidase)